MINSNLIKINKNFIPKSSNFKIRLILTDKMETFY